MGSKKPSPSEADISSSWKVILELSQDISARINAAIEFEQTDFKNGDRYLWNGEMNGMPICTDVISRYAIEALRVISRKITRGQIRVNPNGVRKVTIIRNCTFTAKEMDEERRRMYEEM